MLNEKTRFGLTFGQLISIVSIVFTFTMGYSKINTDIMNMQMRITNLEHNHKELDKRRNDMMDMLHEIKNSQIRMEGKLDMKQDKFEK